MSGDRGGEDGRYDQPRVPAALRERVDELYERYRGYEPRSFQESLGFVVDLAAAAAARDADGAVLDGTADGGPPWMPAADGDGVDLPSVDPLPDVPDADVESAQSVESILETQHADGVVEELATEVIEEMTDDAFEELEHGVDQGVGAGVTDGMGGTRVAAGEPTAPSGSDDDGVPESLTADPEAECASCGRDHRVSVLQTTIADDGSVALVCPSCAN